MGNADESHYSIICDNGRQTGITGYKRVRFADVVPGGRPMTMTVRILCRQHAAIHVPMIEIKNKNCFYPIRSFSDSVSGEYYR